MVYEGITRSGQSVSYWGLEMSKCPVCDKLIHVATEQFKFVVVEGGSRRVLDKAPTDGVCYLVAASRRERRQGGRGAGIRGEVDFGHGREREVLALQSRRTGHPAKATLAMAGVSSSGLAIRGPGTATRERGVSGHSQGDWSSNRRRGLDPENYECDADEDPSDDSDSETKQKNDHISCALRRPYLIQKARPVAAADPALANRRELGGPRDWLCVGLPYS